MPCYALARLSQASGLLAEVGDLLERIWYPGTAIVRIGVGNRERYVKGTNRQILKPCCIACPTRIEAIGPAYPGFDELPKSRIQQCIRVNVGESLDRSSIVLKGPKSMSAKDYLSHQLFGSEWQSVNQQMQAQNWRTVNTIAWLPHNKTMFSGKSPWLWGRLAAYTQDGQFVSNNSRNEAKYDELDGYYVTATGKPFIPPRFWQHRSDNGNTFTTDPDYDNAGSSMLSGFPASYAMSRSQYELQSGFNKTRDGLIECEYWFNQSAFHDWSEEQCQYYAQLFFSDDVRPMVWVSIRSK